MAKTIKFNLICDNTPVRTIEDLQNNFSIEDVLDYYRNGLLCRWLKVRGYEKELKKAGMSEKQTHDPIVNEAKNGLKNDKYTIAMARTSDPDSATAQFFINVANNDFLNYNPGNPGYAVFGRVTKGTEVVDAIAKVRTGRRGWYDDVPLEDIVILKAEAL